VDTLSSPEKARLAEALRVRSTFGEAVWPGFDQADNPVLEYNEANVFLACYSHPPAGWIKVPDPGLRGQAWQAVAGDAFQGQVYYRQPVSYAAGQIGSFTVRIGERWTATMATKEWGTIELVSQVRDVLPPVVKEVLPYRLLLPQVLDSGQYIFKLVHESFHAFQSKLDAALASPRLLAIQRDTRFYSAGMMQAFLLDDLMPDWKSRIFNDGVYLEDLLCQALAEPSS
jgi:hypothetical protein